RRASDRSRSGRDRSPSPSRTPAPRVLSSSGMDLAIEQPSLFTSAEQRRAPRILAGAPPLGPATQALVWHTGVGATFFVMDLLFLGASIAVFRRGPIRATAWGAIACAVLLGFSVLRYASTWTLLIAVPVDLAVLAAIPVLLRDGPSLEAL